MTMPIFFSLLMGLAAFMGVFAMWQSLRATFHAGHLRDLPSLDTGETHRALEDEKEALLGNIRDLRFEHEAGKIADNDFKSQDERLRARAREVLRLLDENIDAYVKRAEALITESLGPDGRTPYRDPASAPEPAPKDGASKSKSKSKSKSPEAQRDCASCGVSNDLDAEFCKKCGKPLADPKCSGCGTTNDLDAEFCKKCGTKLSVEAADDSHDTATGAESEAEASETESGSAAQPTDASSTDTDESDDVEEERS